MTASRAAALRWLSRKAVTPYLDDVGMVSKPIQRDVGQPLEPAYIGPLTKQRAAPLRRPSMLKCGIRVITPQLEDDDLSSYKLRCKISKNDAC